MGEPSDATGRRAFCCQESTLGNQSARGGRPTRSTQFSMRSRILYMSSFRLAIAEKRAVIELRKSIFHQLPDLSPQHVFRTEARGLFRVHSTRNSSWPPMRSSPFGLRFALPSHGIATGTKHPFAIRRPRSPRHARLRSLRGIPRAPRSVGKASLGKLGGRLEPTRWSDIPSRFTCACRRSSLPGRRRSRKRST